jgi:hypothetical protein
MPECARFLCVAAYLIAAYRIGENCQHQPFLWLQSFVLFPAFKKLRWENGLGLKWRFTIAARRKVARADKSAVHSGHSYNF